jgi:SpoVK/Ycf46/Vps4 family AAA+-type ATPase
MRPRGAASLRALLRDLRSSLSEADVRRVGSQTGGYSAYDLTELCRDAALAPLRENRARVRDLSADQLRASAPGRLHGSADASARERVRIVRARV